MAESIVIVESGPRLWAVEGGVEIANRIEEITGNPATLVSLLSFDSFLSQHGKQDAFGAYCRSPVDPVD